MCPRVHGVRKKPSVQYQFQEANNYAFYYPPQNSSSNMVSSTLRLLQSPIVIYMTKDMDDTIVGSSHLIERVTQDSDLGSTKEIHLNC